MTHRDGLVEAVTQDRVDRYWRREAEHQAHLVRHLEGLLILERNQHRWRWWATGVALGALVGWCLAVWRLG